MTDVWLLVHAERAALIDDLVGLTDAQWAHPSLCEGWTVHDVAAHLVDNAMATRRGILRAMVRPETARRRDTAGPRTSAPSPSETAWSVATRRRPATCCFAPPRPTHVCAW